MLSVPALLHICLILPAVCLQKVSPWSAQSLYPTVAEHEVRRRKQQVTVNSEGQQATEGVAFQFGPFPSKRHALHYFHQWSKGVIAARPHHGHGPQESNTSGAPLVKHLRGTRWSMHCAGALGSKSEALDLLMTMSDDEHQVRHFLFRSHAHRLQYVAMRSDEHVVVADPPCRVPQTQKATILMETDPFGGLTGEEPDVDEAEMLEPASDPLVADCVQLFRRTAEENCNKIYQIETISADLRVVDGFEVDVVMHIGDKQHTAHCIFEVAQPGHTQRAEPAVQQLTEETQGMTSMLRMNGDLCTADSQGEVVSGTLIQRRQMLGDLTCYKGYRHANDHLPLMLLDEGIETAEELDWVTQYPKCFPGSSGKEVIRNQGACGSCWAFAAASALMNSLCINGAEVLGGMHVLAAVGERYEIAVQQEMSCNTRARGCSGGQAADADEVWRAKGISKERDSLYQCSSGAATSHFQEGNSCEEYPWGGSCQPTTKNLAWTYVGARRATGEDAMKQSIAWGFGTFVAFIVYPNFMSYDGGVYHSASGSQYGGHAVSLVGYGTEAGVPYWRLMNSWGDSWGENGYFRFLRGQDLCQIETLSSISFSGTVSLVAHEGEAPQEEAISAGEANVDVDVVVARCNSYTCPSSYYMRVNAASIECKGETCTTADDKGTCCKSLTKEVSNAKCKGSEARDWFEQYTLADCVEWALTNGASFFVYGKGTRAQQCWWQRALGEDDCEGEHCCQCPNCAWEDDEFDFYKLT